MSFRKDRRGGKEAVERFRRNQRGRCAICRIEFGEDVRDCLDHCHDSGKLRGLLCVKCNNGLGLFGDDVWKLVRACLYLDGAYFEQYVAELVQDGELDLNGY